MSPLSIFVWTLVYGVLWNALGWAGNNFLLENGWDAVSGELTPDFAPPWSAPTRELFTFVSDFVYAFAFVWLFAGASKQTVSGALKLVLVLWLAGAVVTYMALVNSGFLPWPIAVQTSLLALAVFLVTAPILPLMKRQDATR